MRLFITGTGTDVGKTLVSALILAAAKAQQFPLSYFKPIQSGSYPDCETVKHLSAADEATILHPIFSFALPIDPWRASMAEGKAVTFAPILKRLESNPIPCLIEGAGGLLCPIAESLTVRDLIKALKIPMLIVASTQLGTMNHTLLTIEAAQAAGLEIRGIVLSGPPDSGRQSPLSLKKVLNEFTSAPIVAEIPMIEDLSAARIGALSTQWFSKGLLDKLIL